MLKIVQGQHFFGDKTHNNMKGATTIAASFLVSGIMSMGPLVLCPGFTMPLIQTSAGISCLGVTILYLSIKPMTTKQAYVMAASCLFAKIWPFMMFFLYGYFGQEFICVYQLYTPLFCIWDLIGTCFLFSMASGESMEIRQSNSSGIRPPNPSLFSRQTPLPGTTRIETREDEMRYWNITPEELARYRASSPIGGNNDL